MVFHIMYASATCPSCILMCLPLVFDLAVVMSSSRIMVRPANHATLLIPFVFASESHSAAAPLVILRYTGNVDVVLTSAVLPEGSSAIKRRCLNPSKWPAEYRGHVHAALLGH